LAEIEAWIELRKQSSIPAPHSEVGV
jgi:hypothetical protein